MGPPPYGYKKDPDDPKRWIVDEEAAQVVRRVFRMTLDGYGTEQIATIFSEEKILTPIAYWREKGVNRPGKSKLRGPYMWNSSTITHILSLQEHCGDILNFKTLFIEKILKALYVFATAFALIFGFLMLFSFVKVGHLIPVVRRQPSNANCLMSTTS